LKHKVFSRIIKDFFENSLKQIFSKIKEGKIIINSDYTYPSHLRIAESKSHLIAELMGTQDVKSVDDIDIYRPVRQEKIENTTSFFNPGINIDESEISTFKIKKANYVIFKNLALATKFEEELFLKKVDFPISKTKIIGLKDAKLPLIVKPGCNVLILQNVDLIRTDLFRVYFRTFSTAIAVKKDMLPNELNDLLYKVANKFLQTIPPTIFGLKVGYSHSSEYFARDLLSLTDQKVNETIIDKFVQNHLDFFIKALGYRTGQSQRRLVWIEKMTDDDPNESIPDYLTEREDGYYDIIDLKTAVLKYKKIVIGARKRPRFKLICV